MSARKSAVTKATEDLRKQADEIDERRRTQIANQVATIDRLLGDPDAAREIARLHELLAEVTAERDALLQAREAPSPGRTGVER